jgi:hypothetical protein
MAPDASSVNERTLSTEWETSTESYYDASPLSNECLDTQKIMKMNASKHTLHFWNTWTLSISAYVFTA